MEAQTTTKTNGKPVAPPVPARKPLSAMVAQKTKPGPLRIMVHGVEGVGKTTFAAAAPDPIFLGTEDGFGPSISAAKFEPAPKTWRAVLDAIRALRTEDHSFRTLVIDTVDWLEPLLWQKVCDDGGVAGIEEVGGGFGKGYIAAYELWRQFISEVEALRTAKGMMVILLAHSHVKTFRNPEGADYDRYQLKMHERAAGILREWCDIVLFAQYATTVNTRTRKETKGKATGGARMLYAEHTPAYDAKNRHNLPAVLPLSWDEFASYVDIDGTQADARCAAVRAEIEAMRDKLGDEGLARMVNEALEKFGTNMAKLVEIANRLRVRVEAQEQGGT